MSWAVLAARYCMDHPYEHGGALLQGFLSWCEGRPWPAPVALGEPGEALPVASVMPVLAPAQPPRDTARTVTEGSLRVLRGELRRAVGLVSEARRHQAAAGELFEEATPPGQTHRLVARGDAAEREEQRGRAQASLLAEVAALEAQGRRVRVYARWVPCPEGEELRLGLDEHDAPGGSAPRPPRGRGGRR
jgi:poly(A) polymerase